MWGNNLDSIKHLKKTSFYLKILPLLTPHRPREVALRASLVSLRWIFFFLLAEWNGVCAQGIVSWGISSYRWGIPFDCSVVGRNKTLENRSDATEKPFLTAASYLAHLRGFVRSRDEGQRGAKFLAGFSRHPVKYLCEVTELIIWPWSGVAESEANAE